VPGGPQAGAADLLEKLTVTQLAKNLPAFCGTRRSITVTQGPATGPYTETDAPSPQFLLQKKLLNTKIKGTLARKL